MTRVEICGITRVEDALVAALPPFVTSVGLFVNAAEAFVREVLANVLLGLLQFRGDEPPWFCAQFAKPYIPISRRSASKPGWICYNVRRIFIPPKACC